MPTEEEEGTVAEGVLLVGAGPMWSPSCTSSVLG